MPDVWVQKVTTGLERFTVMLVYEPAGTVADVPRKAESLCNLVRSTLKAALFSGIFTADPLEGVSVMEVISTMKERRLVLGGGVSGAAVRARSRKAYADIMRNLLAPAEQPAGDAADDASAWIAKFAARPGASPSWSGR